MSAQPLTWPRQYGIKRGMFPYQQYAAQVFPFPVKRRYPTRRNRFVTVDGPTLYRMASTRDYDAELFDGRIVDLHDYVMSCYEPDNMSGFFKKIAAKIKRAFKKPLTRILPYVGLAVGIGGAIAPATLGAKMATSPVIAGLAKANKVVELVGTVRSYIEAGGITPTEAEVNETASQIMARFPTVYTPTPTVPVPAPTPTAPPAVPSPWTKLQPYLPYAAGGFGLLIFAALLKSILK